LLKSERRSERTDDDCYSNSLPRWHMSLGDRFDRRRSISHLL